MSFDILEILRQYSFLSSVLAGFAITVAIELVALRRKSRVASLAIAAFLLSSVVSVVATFTFVFVMTGVIGPPGFPRPTDAWIAHFVGGIGVLPMVGLILFLIGIALIGWLHSKALGMLTSASAVLALVLLVYILSSFTVR